MVVMPANGRLDDARIVGRAAGEGLEAVLSLPGLVAAVSWAIGLAVGVFGLLAGHAGVVILASVVVVVAPLLGVAWLSYGHRHRAGGRSMT
jgi:hypothetical protein